MIFRYVLVNRRYEIAFFSIKKYVIATNYKDAIRKIYKLNDVTKWTGLNFFVS